MRDIISPVTEAVAKLATLAHKSCLHFYNLACQDAMKRRLVVQEVDSLGV